MTISLSDMILRHTGIAELDRKMAALYSEIDAAIAARNPTCWNRGVCCKFGSFGHRLFVTGMELAYFVSGQKTTWKPPTSVDACPYQEEGKCTVREHRPLGCRIFFCDPASQDWQGPETERWLAQIRQLESELNIPYRYVEWLSALKEINESTPAEGSGLTPLPAPR